MKAKISCKQDEVESMNKKYNELHIQQAMILSQALAGKPQAQLNQNQLLQTLMGA